MLALSVSISTSGSPRLTSPPSSTNHLRMVPSSMESDRRGMVTSEAISPQSPVPSPQEGASYVPEGRQRCVHDMLFMRERCLLERLRVRHRYVGAGHALYRRVHVVEGLFLDQGGQVGSHAAVGPALLHDHGAVGLLHRFEDRVEVERTQRARVDHLRLDLVVV